MPGNDIISPSVSALIVLQYVILNSIRRRMLIITNFKAYVDLECKEIEAMLVKVENKKLISADEAGQIEKARELLIGMEEIGEEILAQHHLKGFGLKPADID